MVEHIACQAAEVGCCTFYEADEQRWNRQAMMTTLVLELARTCQPSMGALGNDGGRGGDIDFPGWEQPEARAARKEDGLSR
jgi:hypothetical protein